MFKMTPIVKRIIIINFIIYFIFQRAEIFYDLMALSPNSFFNEFKLFQIISYQYLHDPSNLWHIIMNMAILFFFGSHLEQRWGSKNFFLAYTAAGAFAGFIEVLLASNNVRIIGASGSVMAIFCAYALYYPNREIYIYMLFPVKIKYVFTIYILFDLYSAINLPNNGIANYAHLAGALIGYLYVVYYEKNHKSYDWQENRRTSFSQKSNYFEKIKNIFEEKSNSKVNFTRADKDDYSSDKVHFYRAEVDRLLDKINEIGYLKLSDEERKKLEEASDYLKKYDSN